MEDCQPSFNSFLFIPDYFAPSIHLRDPEFSLHFVLNILEDGNDVLVLFTPCYLIQLLWQKETVTRTSSTGAVDERRNEIKKARQK